MLHFFKAEEVKVNKKKRFEISVFELKRISVRSIPLDLFPLVSDEKPLRFRYRTGQPHSFISCIDLSIFCDFSYMHNRNCIACVFITSMVLCNSYMWCTSI